MRILLFLILFGFLAMNGYSQTDLPLFNNKDSTIITGIVKFYDPLKDDQMISFWVKDLTGRSIAYSALINHDGSFRCSILQPYSGDFSVIHKRIYTNLYSSPGEKVRLIIHNDNIDSTGNLPAIFEVTGKSSSVSKGILLYNFEQASASAKEPLPKMNDKSLSDEEFAMQTRNYAQKKLMGLDTFLERNNLKNNQVLQNWLTNTITYSAAHDILFHPFQGKLNTSMSPVKLKELIGDIPFSREGSFHNSKYYAFLDLLAGVIQICVNFNPAFEPATNKFGKNGYPVYLMQVDNLQLPIPVNEMLYFDIYNMAFKNKITTENILKFKDLYFEKVQSSYLKNNMIQLRNSLTKEILATNIIEKIQNFATTDIIKNHLINLIGTATKDKYVFIDFWGSWCPPCMAEMSNYAALIDTMRNKPINFLFLSYQTEDKSVNQTKKKFGINASFNNLSDDEINVLTQIFGFTTYPSHFLVAPGGILITRYNQPIDIAARNKELSKKNPIDLFSLIN